VDSSCAFGKLQSRGVEKLDYRGVFDNLEGLIKFKSLKNWIVDVIGKEGKIIEAITVEVKRIREISEIDSCISGSVETLPSNWIDAHTIVFYSPDIWKDVIKLNRKPTMVNRTIMVDTNYLTLINNKDFISMLLDPNYENSVTSPQKRQMARLFRDFTERKIDLCFSDIVMREFIGRAPKRKDLLEIYKRYIIVITPKSNLASYFWDLAAAVNSCIIEIGEEGDIKDTYSYIIIALARINYFVTEDRDVERVYRYFTRVREKSWEERKREIMKIKGVFKLLCGASNTGFPIDEILGFLFFNEHESLPIPVSIAGLEDRLPEVLDRSEVILWLFRLLQEIDRLRNFVSEMPPEWDEEIVERARKRISDIAESIGLGCIEGVDEYSFQKKLIEEGTKWTEQPYDSELAQSLNDQLSLLHSIIYSEEVENEYADWEEMFFAEEPSKTFRVTCKECGTSFEIETDYVGVVCSDPREMGTEHCHQWLGESSCPSCGRKVSIVHELWEYPEFFYNWENTECDGCELIREKTTEQPTTTLEKFFENQHTENSKKTSKQYP